MSETIPTPREAMNKLQEQALDAIRSYQTAALKTIEAWNEAYEKAPANPSLGMQTNVDPADLVDSNYSFASQVLDLNQKFAHQLIDAAKSASETTSRKAPKS